MAPRTSVPSVGPFASIAARLRSAAKPSGENPDDSKDDDEEDEDSEDDGDGKKKKTKKQKKAEDEEDEEDEEDDGDPEARAARGREKARVLAIMNSTAARSSPGASAAALNVALNTSIPRHAAIKMLGAMVAHMPKSGVGSLRDRMASVVNPDIGPGGDEAPAVDDPKALAARIILAGKRARGEVE
jgi:hypothetical protein